MQNYATKVYQVFYQMQNKEFKMEDLEKLKQYGCFLVCDDDFTDYPHGQGYEGRAGVNHLNVKGL